MRISDYEGADYERNFWQAPGRQYDDQIERVAMRRLLPVGGRLLELASGYGRLTNLYSGFQQVVLVDLNLAHLEAARERYGDDGYLYVAADIYNLPFAPGQFDVVTMVRALHHMDDPQRALRGIRAVLRRGGSLVLEYNNKRNLKTVAKWLLKKMLVPGKGWAASAHNPFTREPVQYYSLYYGLHPEHVKDMLVHAGLVPQRRLAVAYLRVSLLTRLLPPGLMAKLDSAMQLTGDWFLFSPTGFVRARAVGGDEEGSPSAFWRCPACHGFDLRTSDQGLACQGCGRDWPIKNGVIDFRIPVEEELLVSVAATTGW